MALNFTDEQIKELSGQVLQGPDIIEEANEQVANAEQTKQDFKELDEQNKVFTDNMINIIDQFHKELKEIDGTVKTLYDESNIDESARLVQGNAHYPDGWQYFYPKVLDSNKGLPTSTTSDLIEPDAIDEVQEDIDYLKNGFSDGAISDDSSGPIAGGEIPFETDPGFGVGDRIVLLEDGGVTGASFGVVTGKRTESNPSPPPANLVIVEYNSFFSAGSLPAGTTVSNFHPGFTNNQRETVTNNHYLEYLRDELDGSISDWKPILEEQQTILNANDSSADSSEIDSAKSSVNDALNAINTWESQPGTGVGVGKYGDAQLGPIESQLTNRENKIPSRVTEINDSLGTLTQDLNDKAKFNGQGRYFDYFTHLNARIHLGTGSLRNFYNQDQLIAFSEQTRDNTIAEVERATDVLFIKLLREEPDGSDTIALENVSKFVIGQQVKFMDNQKPVLNYTIVSIIPDERKLVLDGAVPTNYQLTQQVRVVRVL